MNKTTFTHVNGSNERVKVTRRHIDDRGDVFVSFVHLDHTRSGWTHTMGLSEFLSTYY